MASRRIFQLFTMMALATAAHASFEVSVDRAGQVSLRARNAPVREVASAIAARAGIRFTIDEASAVQARFQRVLGALNHELVTGPGGRPSELRVVQKKNPPLIPVVDASKIAPLAPPAPPTPVAPPAPAPAPAPATAPAADRPPFVVAGVELPGLATPEEKAALPAIKTEMAANRSAHPVQAPVAAAPVARPATLEGDAEGAASAPAPAPEGTIADLLSRRRAAKGR
jgi:hypothetical protein